MTWLALSTSPVQYVDTNGDAYSGAVLKAYSSGTSTNINISIDDAGGTLVTSVALNAAGYPAVSGNVIVLHVEEKYKLALYADQTAADADSGALWTVDELTAPVIAGTNTDTLVKVSSNDTTANYLNGKLVAGTNVALTEGSDGGNETLTVSALDAATGLRLTETADHVQTPAAGFGEIWVKSNTPNVLMFTDDAGTDSIVGGAAATVVNHVRAGNMQIVDGSQTAISFDVGTNVAENVEETIGPTVASDNQWSGISIIPTNAKILICDVFVDSNKADSYATIGFAAGDVTMFSGISSDLWRMGVTGSTRIYDMTRVFIPLSNDTDQNFTIIYGDALSGDVGVVLYYRGFMTD